LVGERVDPPGRQAYLVGVAHHRASRGQGGDLWRDASSKWG
jgi:hypothetical protein